MDKPIETFKVGRYSVEIHYDTDPMNPRTENSNSDLFICLHKRYTLGDKHNYKVTDFDSWKEMERQIIKDHDPAYITPIYMYDHSGITIATSPFSCRWDSGQIGFALISKKAAKEVYSVKGITKTVKEKCKEYVEASVKEYDMYLRGESYGYIIKDEKDEEVDSCWGYLGMDSVKEDATNTAKHLEKEDIKEIAKNIETELTTPK